DKSAREIVALKGWEKLADLDQLGAIVQEVLASNGELVKRFENGETKLFGFFVGQVMRATNGKGDPELVNELLRKELGA
ncbi:MAG: Asp-tRNA(Asn)/Glu-tRNA(Gln) amidotransferase GatCAB subunit B, partial [Firmicutes bacterium]|nr:Asp-tRNA(Asn)/Glu-tRNA(Gln) amidotransferase GatCAB subunit B [Bacillota bacterium]